jgi:ribonuclease VapC
MAIILEEPDASAYYAAIANSAIKLISAVTLVEASLVLIRRRKPAATDVIDLLLDRLRIEIISVDERQALLAREAFRHFGKGLHPAGLNFGDCFPYALAKQTGQPLLYKGDDFRHTDIVPA